MREGERESDRGREGEREGERENTEENIQDEPRMLTVVAYIDPNLEDEQIAHISCLYDSTTHAKCEWLRSGQ